MRDQKHPSTNQAGTGGSSGATKPRSAPSRYTPPPNPGPLFCPPTNHQRFFRVFDSVDLFSFHSSDGAMPYVPRSRALISVLARSRLHATTEPVFCEMPALGEGACANRGLSELDQLSMYTYELGPDAFLPVGKAFKLPKSIFAEVPVILGIFDHDSFTRVNLPFPFWAACAIIEHFAPLQESFDPEDDHGEDPLWVTIVAVGYQVINAGTPAHWDQDEVLPANDNQSLWTRFWERYGQFDSYFQLLSIAKWNARHLRGVALRFALPPSNPAIRCWDLWPSFHADCGPPPWLTKLIHRVPPEGSASYPHKITTISCPYHGEIVVQQHYHPGFEVTRRSTSKRKRIRFHGPPHPFPPPTRTVGCFLPKWLIALDPDKPPPEKLLQAERASGLSTPGDIVANTAESLFTSYCALLVFESALQYTLSVTGAPATSTTTPPVDVLRAHGHTHCGA